MRDLSLRWENGQQVLHGISFSAQPGQIIGVTGAVASGKSMLGKALLGELPYEGSIEVDERELRTLSLYERSRLLSYLGHEPELMTESIEENIRLGEKGEIARCLKTVCLADEICKMPRERLHRRQRWNPSVGRSAGTSCAETAPAIMHGRF